MTDAKTPLAHPPVSHSPPSHQAGLRQLLVDAHEQLAQRDRQLRGLIQGLTPQLPSDQPEVLRVREIVQRIVPQGASLLVISKGDDAILQHRGRQAWHFPHGPTGAYAWSNPENSSDAIALLEQSRFRGSGIDYLLIPASSFWWLTHYSEFGRHLERYPAAWRDDACIILRLDRRRPTLDPGVKPAVTPLPLGVNIAGNFHSEKGTGEAVRANVRSLAAAGVPFALNYVPDESSSNQAESVGHPFSNDNPYAINLIHLNPDSVDGFLDDWGERHLRGRYNIGYWVWELSDFPDKWSRVFDFFDEIWVPSDFVLDAIARKSPVPVVKIPHSVHETGKPPLLNRARFGMVPGVFCFFFMFDFHSFVERKNPLGLIEAFKRAFGNRTDVQLLLKCSRSTPADLQLLQRAAQGSKVRIFDQILDRAELNALMNQCDCYVSLHRSEGFGLTLAEAMNLGKPVIATGYSGNMEFMTRGNSFTVKHSLLRLPVDHGDYQAGSSWAQPDVAHAAELMRQVHSQPQLTRDTALRGQREVRERLSAAAVGRLMRDRIQRIAAIAGLTGEPTASLTALAGTFIPPHVRVAVMNGTEPVRLARGQRATPFPQKHGQSPADESLFDNSQLMAHLEILRRLGTEYLFIGPASLRALRAKPEFLRLLQYACSVVRDQDESKIYQLTPPARPRFLREIPVAITPLETHGMRREADRWSSDGADCHLVLGLPAPLFVSAIQLVFRFAADTARPEHAGMSRVFWVHAGEFNDQQTTNLKQRLFDDVQTRLVVINDTIDSIRFDPDLQPAVLDRLEISLLVPDHTTEATA